MDGPAYKSLRQDREKANRVEPTVQMIGVQKLSNEVVSRKNEHRRYQL